MVAVNVLPYEEQVIREGMLEKWDYCLRRLFVLKGQSVKTAIVYVSHFSVTCEGYSVDLNSSFSVD